ncbi:MAG: 2-amino-4-hydroxy-6-hydroxymethyldihydropteridine diphosphokinase [Rikenellaceae bacterium]
MISVILLLGGNLGEMEQTFARVREDLESEVGQIVNLSSIERSKAWGFQADDFLNQAVELETSMEPEELLDAVQRIENRWGRARAEEARQKQESGERYTSRSIDVDIIFYGDQAISTERLTVPHPLVEQREFVLKPLAQIASQRRHAITGRSVEQMLNDLKC